MLHAFSFCITLRRELFCALTVTIAVSTSSCSLNRFEHDECTANTDCRSAFGFGSVCSAEGFCEDPAILPRCRETYPEDIFENR